MSFTFISVFWFLHYTHVWRGGLLVWSYPRHWLFPFIHPMMILQICNWVPLSLFPPSFVFDFFTLRFLQQSKYFSIFISQRIELWNVVWIVFFPLTKSVICTFLFDPPFPWWSYRSIIRFLLHWFPFFCLENDFLYVADSPPDSLWWSENCSREFMAKRGRGGLGGIGGKRGLWDRMSERIHLQSSTMWVLWVNPHQWWHFCPISKSGFLIYFSNSV